MNLFLIDVIITIFNIIIDIPTHNNRLHHIKRHPPLTLLLLTCLFSNALVNNPKPEMQQPIIQ